MKLISGCGSPNLTKRNKPSLLPWGSLMAKLDDVFLKEEKDRAYEAYSHFDGITKSAIRHGLPRRKKQTASTDGMYRTEVFIYEVSSKTDFRRKDDRLVKRNTSEPGHGIFHRTKITRKRKTERNVARWTTKATITRDKSTG
ncbi:hypothetical protein QQF64_034119 [Cirrhinus molitorella]|uniref:Uncharacterized protein n=1 Tax=Cirrhinus molitorella TaxID=172907 RepID=A0ABR3MVY1_9TELE